MTPNKHGVPFRIEQSGAAFSVLVLDVTTVCELDGFKTQQCAEAYASELKPIINRELLHG